MAFIPNSNHHQPLQKYEDPWFWTTEEVIAALCHKDGPLRTSGSQRSFPNPQVLAQALEENAISGPSLLTDLNHVSLRDDLGIKVLGHRTSVLHYIQDLRHQSPKYLEHVRKISAPIFSPADIAAGSGCITSFENTPYRLFNQHGPEADRSSVSSTKYAIPGIDLNTYVSPTPSTAADGLPVVRKHPSEALVGTHKIIEASEDTVNIDGKGITEGSRLSKRPHSPGADRIISHATLTSNSAMEVNVSEFKAIKGVRLAETCIIDESGRKRRRLDLSAQVPEIKTGPTLDEANPTGSPNLYEPPEKIDVLEGVEFGPTLDEASPTGSSNLYEPPEIIDVLEGVEPQLDSKLQHQTTPPAGSLNLPEPGTVITDEQGRKRVIPIKVAHIDQAREFAGLEPQISKPVVILPHSSTTSPVASPLEFQEAQRQVPSVRKPHQIYLGLKSSDIDTIFYGETQFGEKVKNDYTMGNIWRANSLENSDTESFVFSGQPFGKGLRRYVGARIKHYLMSSPLTVHGQQGQVMLAPYPETLLKKTQRVSATVFSTSPTGPIALRIDRSKYVQSKLKSGHDLGENVLGTSSPIFAQGVTADVDWSYLQKWDRRAAEDKILPIYGESGSEGEYDPQTWHEMEAEKKHAHSSVRRPQKRYISQAEVEESLDDAERQMVARWEASKKPALQRKARSFWEVHRKDSRERSQINLSLERLKKRLSKIRSEIMGMKWTSTKQLQKQCKSMEASIFDREELSWSISVLNKKSPPPRMSPLSSTKSKATLKDKSSAKRWSGSSDLDDFISEDDVLSLAESATGVCEDSESENSHERYNGEPDTVLQTPDDKLAGDDPKSLPRVIKSDPSQYQPRSTSKKKVDHQPNFIDLTQRSDSSSVDNSPAKLLSSGIVSGSSSHHRDPLVSKLKKLAKFKIPPGASPTIVIDSDPIEPPVQDDLLLSELGEVKGIARRDPDEFVMLKDRKRLLFWTIEKTSADLRDNIIAQVENTSLEEIKSTIWTGLKVIERNKGLRIRGLDEQDSRSYLLLASWFVCWTIPVKLNTKGVDVVYLRTTMENEGGFSGFFEFLKRALATFKSSSADQSSQSQRKSRGPALQEDQSSYLLSTPHKKRKYAVPESVRTMSLRANALLRVQERDKRQELLKRRFKEMGVNDEDASKVIVNPGKHDDQSFIYLNPKIADRIQPHQIDGVRFMWREVIADHQGCLLAQTMGLGKTMQIITLLVTIAEAAKSDEDNIRGQVPEDLRKSRTLILCPPALIENWWDEFLMWTPLPSTANIGELRKVTRSLKVTERLWEIQAWKEEGGVLLLGFHTFRDLIQNKAKATGKRMLDDEQHRVVTETLLSWPNIIVADEAHAAKTAGSGINVTLNSVKSMTRIALTGSPLANNLEEYHSLIDWIAPGYLGTPLEFKVNYVEKIQAGLWQDSTAVQYRDSLKRLEALKQELAPKVHRADITVLQGRLKEKVEFVIKVALTPLQEEVYQVYVETMRTVIEGQLKQRTTSSVWVWLAVLRLLCNHPKCFRDKLLSGNSSDSQDTLKSKKVKSRAAPISADKEVTTPDDVLADALVDTPVSSIGISQTVQDMQLAPFDRVSVPLETASLSNKMQILMDILKFSREAKDKVLIFSHSLHTLSYVEMHLRKSQTKFSRIDGAVPTGSRQQITKDFNNDNTEVCLVSIRAGGQGLNLFGANRVVILDVHFNPMYEEQAVGRAYRIGQQKPVYVYHLMAGGTFEETLHNQSLFKQQLAKRVVDKKNPIRQAYRALREYLHPPRAVEQKDLISFEGKDEFVLDRILAAQNE